MPNVQLQLELSEDQAEALALLAKRFGWDHAHQLAVRFDGGRERDHMLAAVAALRRALAEAGYAPR